jgi:ATP phosphoribosyltransferase regulatory subunit
MHCKDKAGKKMENTGTVLMPGGVRDLLPEEARRKRVLEAGLLDLFASWGYQEVVTPTFEFYEALAPAMSTGIHDQLYRFIDDRGRIMVLRPDMTTPIARLISTRLKDQEMPERFCYVANVFRRENHAGRQREFHQAGVELVGAAGADADAEIICLAGKALKLAGVKEFRLTVGHVEILSGILTGAGFTAKEQELARAALNNKDLVAWEQLITKAHLTGKYKEAIAGLPYLHGGLEILDQVRDLVSDEGALAGIETLQRVWSALQAQGLSRQVAIDLTLLRGLDYYTGIVFEGYTAGVGYPLCGGGRYDQLLANFGFPCPATGFALATERIMSAQEPEAVPGERLPDYFLTGQNRDEISRRANDLRESGCLVEVEVAGRKQQDSVAYASRKGIPHILVVD